MTRVGYILLGSRDGKLASTRIRVLNVINRLEEKGYSPVILDEGKEYNPNRDLSHIMPIILSHGFTNNDIVYFQSMKSESAVKLAENLNDMGIITVLGICNFIASKMAETCDHTIVPSSRLRDSYPAFIQDKISVIHDGIEFPQFVKKDYSSSNNGHNLKAVYLTGKRYEHIPNFYLGKGYDLTVIGPYGSENVESFRVPRTVDEKKITGVYSDRGIIGFEKEIWSLDSYGRIKDFDIGVLPIDLKEPMPRVDQAPTETRSANKLTQMMYFGMPVIAGELPAYIDVITDGVDGFIARTEKDWARAYDALRDETFRRNIGLAARERVKNEFSLESQIEKLVLVFDRLVEEGRENYRKEAI